MKGLRIAEEIRRRLAKNIADAMLTRGYVQRNGNLDVVALAKDAGVSAPHVRRILGGDSGASIDAIDFIAAALRQEAWMLLLPEDVIDLADASQAITQEETEAFSLILRAYVGTTHEGRKLIHDIAVLQQQAPADEG